MMSDDDFPWNERADGELPVVVAGGGISGLYCAYRLAQRGRRVVVLERSRDCWGGRIETAEMDGFIAEYGPMRFELHLQPCLKKLLGELGIETEPFSGPSAEVPEFPKYDLTPTEQGLDSLQLLRRGLLLAMGRVLAPDDPAGERDHQAWLDSLDDAAYDRIRRCVELDGQFLWKMGFWNALSANGVLSHQALMKVRDTGTFYHMLPENLNAAEWTIWWLRAMKTEGRTMQQLKGGSEVLTTRILERLRAFGTRVQLLDDCSVTAFRTEPGRADVVRVTLQRGEDGRVEHALASRLVLALPQWPLKQLAGSLPAEISGLLDTVVGFPMTKVFFVTEKPWWDYDQKPQTRASRMPTREVHYFRRPRDADPDRHGMVLIYTDRPATEYWNVYVNDREGHDRAEIDGNDELKAQFARWLAREAKGAIDHLREVLSRIPENLRKDLGDALGALLPNVAVSDNAIERFAEMTEDAVAQEIADTVITWGIRDWSLPPYGAANHSWRPGVKSWEVMAALKQFRLEAGCPENVHICGEAYSDYSGFIEGALRSAEAALATIPEPRAAAAVAAA